jgi:hypothetical protein
LVFKEENKVFLAVGLILLSISWVALAASLNVFPEEPFTQVVCGALSLTPAILGAIFLALGFSAKRVVEDIEQVLQENERDQQAWLSDMAMSQLDWIDAEDHLDMYWAAKKMQVAGRGGEHAKGLRDQGLKLIILSAVFVAVDIGAFSKAPVHVALVYLALAILPAWFGMYFFLKAAVDKKRGIWNLDALRKYEGEARAWRQAGDKADRDWQASQQAWGAATARWERLYLCERDGVVFVPGEGSWAPLAEVDAYVWEAGQ